MTWPCPTSGPRAQRATPAGHPPQTPPQRLDLGTASAAIEWRTSDGTTIVVIGGELDLVSAPALCELLAQVLRGQPRRLILDLSRTEFIDCGSARLIADVGRRLPPGERPVIRRPSPGVRRVFQLTGLEARCEIEE